MRDIRDFYDREVFERIDYGDNQILNVVGEVQEAECPAKAHSSNRVEANYSSLSVSAGERGDSRLQYGSHLSI